MSIYGIAFAVKASELKQQFPDEFLRPETAFLHGNVNLAAYAFGSQPCVSGQVGLDFRRFFKRAVDNGRTHAGLEIQGFFGYGHAHGHLCVVHDNLLFRAIQREIFLT